MNTKNHVILSFHCIYSEKKMDNKLIEQFQLRLYDTVAVAKCRVERLPSMQGIGVRSPAGTVVKTGSGSPSAKRSANDHYKG